MINYDLLKTPCYIINEREYRNNIETLMNSFNSVWENNVIFGYSCKTNNYPYFSKIAEEYGWYGEVVSNDEYNYLLNTGFSSDRIILNGPVKGESLYDSLNKNCIINLDNMNEVEVVCCNKEKLTSLIGIRINVDLEKYVPLETTVGNDVGRFGFDINGEEIKDAIKLLKNNGIKISGIHLHHSTSSRSLKVFQTLSRIACDIKDLLDVNEIEYIDIGGGFFGGNYFDNKPSFSEYAKCISDELLKVYDKKIVKLIVEPGAAILSTSCDYLTSVVNIRKIRNKEIVTVDGSCLHINPFLKLKQANPCTILNESSKCDKNELQVIGGSTCMEMDRLYPKDIDCLLKNDSKLLFHCAGAYTIVHNRNFILSMPYIYLYSVDNKIKCIRNTTYNDWNVDTKI